MKHLTMLSIRSFLLTYSFLCLLTGILSSQSTVSGLVTDKSGLVIIGANVFIEGSYDGTTTDVDGRFSFTTSLTGEQVLSISYLGYETKKIKDQISTFANLQIEIRESAATLDAVEITASTFKAGDNSKVSVLNPLDVVTTAGSLGDVIAAIQTLPGTQSNAEDGRLFVRGGDARETRIFIDGMRVFSPYTRSVQGTPSRGRYSPFLFKGISFSTGGYDAEFGQALSGVLDMSTIDEPNDTETNISLMTVGLGIGHTTKKEKSSISISASYIDLSPYYWIANSRLNWNTPFRGFGAEMVHRVELGKGLLKNYFAADGGIISLNRTDLDTREEQRIDIDNRNVYGNSTYSSILDKKTSVKAGLSWGINNDETKVDSFQLVNKLRGAHVKAAFKSVFSDFFIMNYGADYMYQEDILTRKLVDAEEGFSIPVSRGISSVFLSADYFVNKNLAFKLGLRSEYSTLIDKIEFDPRITLAYKVGKGSQISAAVGNYRQEIESNFISLASNLMNESSTHYLLNYNLKNDKQIIRLEAYYKDYRNLLTYDEENNMFSNVENVGSGRAYGFDVFWRRDNLIKNFNFWVSYSFLSNNRLYNNFPVKAAPSFSTNHNLSVVGKLWISKMNSQLSFTYQLASGRPYDDPRTTSFMTERSDMFNNFSLSWAYLITQQKILFVSLSNAPGFKNNYGYRYANSPDVSGQYNSELIRPSEDRFVFVGFFITMSKDKTKNQLDSL